MQHRYSLPSFLASACALIGLCSCTPEYTVSIIDESSLLDTLVSGGIPREYEIHLPPNYLTTSVPVVVLFHRADANGRDMRYLTSFDAEADFYGFLAVYPSASSDWAYGCDCTSAEAAGIDDVRFTTDLLDTLEADYNINRDSVFVTGFAEGALMAQKVVCDAAGSFAGLATVGATMSAPVADVCVPSREIPVLMIHGTEDASFPWDGAPDLGAESLLAADTTAQFWATRNGCGERVASVYIGNDYYYNFDVYREGFDGCPANGNVILYRLEDGTHGWPNANFVASGEIAHFFANGGAIEEAPAHLLRK